MNVILLLHAIMCSCMHLYARDNTEYDIRVRPNVGSCLTLKQIYKPHACTTNSASGAHKDQAHIIFSKNAMLQNNTLDKVSVRDSTCSVNKTLYSTIVLASIALIVFCIAMQVIIRTVIEAEKLKDKVETDRIIKPRYARSMLK